MAAVDLQATPSTRLASIIVAGATGAVGREVVVAAVADPHFARVVALSRRAIPPDEFASTFPNIDADLAAQKLFVVAVDWEKLTKEFEAETAGATSTPSIPDSFVGHTVAAMCLGTTRSDAGSAEAFVRVDLHYVKTFLTAVKRRSASTIQHVGQVSATGANSNSWFLYMKTKGQADKMVMEMGFPTTAIYRPGLISRGDKTRANERFFGFFSSGTPAASVAHALLHVACGSLSGLPAPGSSEPLRQVNPFRCIVVESAEIKGLAAGYKRGLQQRFAVPRVVSEAATDAKLYLSCVDCPFAIHFDSSIFLPLFLEHKRRNEVCDVDGRSTAALAEPTRRASRCGPCSC